MIYFVTENYLKTVGIITSNVDVTDFSPLVQFASKAFVKKLIGTYFFNDLLTKYNDQTLSSDEEEVVERMQYAIAWRTCAQAVLTLTYQLKNKGLQKQNDDNAEAVELNEATFMYDNYIQQAKLFEYELAEFLKANKDNYPVFMDKLNKDSSIKDSCCKDRGSEFQEGVGIMII